jgi:hypothetical protein
MCSGFTFGAQGRFNHSDSHLGEEVVLGVRPLQDVPAEGRKNLRRDSRIRSDE